MNDSLKFTNHKSDLLGEDDDVNQEDDYNNSVP